jgi:hypothetical protein
MGIARHPHRVFIGGLGRGGGPDNGFPNSLRKGFIFIRTLELSRTRYLSRKCRMRHNPGKCGVESASSDSFHAEFIRPPSIGSQAGNTG